MKKPVMRDIVADNCRDLFPVPWPEARVAESVEYAEVLHEISELRPHFLSNPARRVLLF